MARGPTTVSPLMHDIQSMIFEHNLPSMGKSDSPTSKQRHLQQLTNALGGKPSVSKVAMSHVDVIDIDEVGAPTETPQWAALMFDIDEEDGGVTLQPSLCAELHSMVELTSLSLLQKSTDMFWSGAIVCVGLEDNSNAQRDAVLNKLRQWAQASNVELTQAAVQQVVFRQAARRAPVQVQYL